MTKINQDGRDALEKISKSMFDDEELDIIMPIRSKREISSLENDSIFVEVIQRRMQMKAVPISLRKRMLYEQSLAS